MKIDVLNLLICLIASLTAIAIYDYTVITPKLNASKIEVVDIDYILSSNEKLVQTGKLSMESYKARIALAEKLVSENKSILLNKYIKSGSSISPLVFGGTDITNDIIKQLEEIK